VFEVEALEVAKSLRVEEGDLGTLLEANGHG
jgi:hypothetical protein